MATAKEKNREVSVKVNNLSELDKEIGMLIDMTKPSTHNEKYVEVIKWFGNLFDFFE